MGSNPIRATNNLENLIMFPNFKVPEVGKGVKGVQRKFLCVKGFYRSGKANHKRAWKSGVSFAQQEFQSRVL